MRNNICGVVVLYNPDKNIIDRISSYLCYIDKLFVIDNTEVKKSQSFIFDIQNLKKVEYVSLGENKGLAYALNYALKKAIVQGFDWILTMDQDTSFLPEAYCYFNCIQNLPTKKIVYISPVYFFDRRRNAILTNSMRKLKWSMTSASLMRLNAIEAVGLFDENLFLDCIDYDMCLKLRKSGYLVYEYSNYGVNHVPGLTKETTLFNIKYGYCSPLRIYYQIRNLFTLFKRYKYHKIILIMFYKLAKIIFLFDRKYEFINMYFKGLLDGSKGKLGKLSKGLKE